MNYTQLTLQKLIEFSDKNPDFTVGQLLYSTLSTVKTKDTFKKSDLLTVSDKDLFTSIEKAIHRESQDQIISQN